MRRISISNFFGKLTFTLIIIGKNEGQYIEKIKRISSGLNPYIRTHLAMLKRLGFVELRSCSNKRIKLVYLTPEGRDILNSNLQTAFLKISKKIDGEIKRVQNETHRNV